MFPAVATSDPDLVEAAVQSAYSALFVKGDQSFVHRIFTWAKDCFTGNYADYQPVDARYHDLEHTLQGTLCIARLLQLRQAAGAQPALDQRTVELGLIAILFHDTGYLKTRDDTAGTGAKYTTIHVGRSANFAGRFLAKMGFPPREIQAVQNMIHCTGVDANLAGIPFCDETERVVGHALGTADLLGQMAADDYVEKLPILYSEFAEAAAYTKDKGAFISQFSSASDLLAKTPAFWEHYVRPKLDREFGGAYRFFNHPYPTGPNWYLDKVEANIEKIRNQLVTDAGTLK